MPEDMRGSSTQRLSMEGSIDTQQSTVATAKTLSKKDAQFDNAMKGFDRLAAAMLPEKEEKAKARQTKLQMNFLSMEGVFSPDTYAAIKSQVLSNAGIAIASDGGDPPGSKRQLHLEPPSANKAKRQTTISLAETQKRMKEFQEKAGINALQDDSSSDDDSLDNDYIKLRKQQPLVQFVVLNLLLIVIPFKLIIITILSIGMQVWLVSVFFASLLSWSVR
jgi:hypothetical protein